MMASSELVMNYTTFHEHTLSNDPFPRHITNEFFAGADQLVTYNKVFIGKIPKVQTGSYMKNQT